MLVPGSPAFAAAAALPKTLAAIGPAADVDWVDVHMLRLALTDGSALWLQTMPEPTGAWVRVTADAPSKASPAIEARTKAIRDLRLQAYHVPIAAVVDIIPQEIVEKNGVAAVSAKPTDLSTRTKQD